MPIRVLSVLLLVSVLTACAASDHRPTASDGGAETPTEPSAAPKEAAAPFTLSSRIAEHRERLRNAPGRTGILAETRRYSLFDEELIIRDFFQDRRDGFFVDVGCAWPIKANNTYYLEKHLGWHGIAIDALGEYAAAWERDRPASQFLRYLVTDHSGTNDPFFKSENVGLSSAHKMRADGTYFGGALEVEEIRIPSTTLDDLLDSQGVTKIDLLAMDIEGHELKALHGFEIERFQPDLVVAEGKRSGVTAYLEKHGYEVIERYQPFDSVNLYYRRRSPEPDSP